MSKPLILLLHRNAPSILLFLGSSKWSREWQCTARSGDSRLLSRHPWLQRCVRRDEGEHATTVVTSCDWQLTDFRNNLEHVSSEPSEEGIPSLTQMLWGLRYAAAGRSDWKPQLHTRFMIWILRHFKGRQFPRHSYLCVLTVWRQASTRSCPLPAASRNRLFNPMWDY